VLCVVVLVMLVFSQLGLRPFHDLVARSLNLITARLLLRCPFSAGVWAFKSRGCGGLRLAHPCCCECFVVCVFFGACGCDTRDRHLKDNSSSFILSYSINSENSLSSGGSVGRERCESRAAT